MGESTAIEWTDATWNPWRGCEKVSPGCAHCYMFRDQRRYGRDPSVVVRAADKTFYAPQKWGGKAAQIRSGMARRMRVFTCSWSDWFHEDADPWREEAWAIVRDCPEFDFQILTKRPERIADHLPSDWGAGYPNAWLGVSIENRRFVDRADLLREVPAAVRFISAEPLLGPLVAPVGAAWLPRPGHPYDLSDESVAREWFGWEWEDGYIGRDLDLDRIDWLIVGGESGPGHRPVNRQWVRALRDECNPGGGWEPSTAFFFKQWGGPRPESGGRELDGRTWSEFPRSAAVAV